MSLRREIDELGYQLAELVRKPVKSPAEVEEMLKIADSFRDALHQEAEPLLRELAHVGIRVKSVWDLVNASIGYSVAVPILIQHLRKPYHPRNKEGIVRALAVKEAQGLANKAVMEEYRWLPEETPTEPWIFHYRWAFGNTMCVIVTADDLDDLIDIVLDARNGDSRGIFITALAKIKSPRVEEVLRILTQDKSERVTLDAQKALKKKRLPI